MRLRAFDDMVGLYICGYFFPGGLKAVDALLALVICGHMFVSSGTDSH